MTSPKFGRYEIKAEIGRGGMATVFHAYDPRFERDVAIKVLPEVFLHDPQFRARFDREAKTIALLEHPAIVPVYDFGEEQGQPYIVMRYMAGGSLSDRLERGPLSVSEAAAIISRLAPALDVAHARGIIHRDLKPGNILFDQYGNAFLSDFGIARLTHEGSAATLTGSAIVGTPAYMSPEQIQGSKSLDGRSDMYSLCVILFQMLTGKMPYHADTPASLMMKHLLEPVPHILEMKADLPPAFETVIERAMAKEPSDRYLTVSEMAAAVDTAARGEFVYPAPDQQATFVVQTPKYDQTAAGRSIPTQAKPGAVRNATSPGLALGGAATAVVQAPPKKTARFPAWLAILGGVAALGVVVLVVIGALFLIPQLFPSTNNQPDLLAAAPPINQTEEQQIESTATSAIGVAPSPTISPSPSPTLTPTVPASPTSTTLPTGTPTLEPTLVTTPTPLPGPIILGGADKLALVQENNIWIANLDGTGLTKLTTDGTEKSSLQWTPDGNSLVYLSGKCVKMVWVEDGRIEDIICFESADYLDAFEISPDGSLVYISLDHEMYIVRYDLAQLQSIRSRNQLKDLAPCSEFTPYRDNIYKTGRWSKDGQKLSVVYGAPVSGRRLDTIRIMDVSKCAAKFRGLDNFPASRFTMSGYNDNPRIESFTWDGELLFALNSFIRNDGFGDLYIYNANLRKLQSPDISLPYINPIDNTCCYRDPRFSPDGRYLLFAFQDVRRGSEYLTQIYYIPYGSVGTGATYLPIPFPENFLVNRTEKPWLALRGVK